MKTKNILFTTERVNGKDLKKGDYVLYDDTYDKDKIYLQKVWDRGTTWIHKHGYIRVEDDRKYYDFEDETFIKLVIKNKIKK